MKLLSPEFMALVFLSLAAYHACSRVVWRRFVLAATSLVFVLSQATGGELAPPALDGWLSLVPLAAFAGVGYLAMLVSHSTPKAVPGLVAGIIALFFACRHLVVDPLTGRELYLTLGLSYIFFRVLHLLIDVSQRDIERPPSPTAYLAYLFFFPTYLSGPIWLYQGYTEDLEKPPPRLTGDDVLFAFSRIATGLLKVLALANASLWCHQGLTRPITGEEALAGPAAGVCYALAALAYLAYFYFDFSGYVDIVAGVGRLYGLTLPENFDRPFECHDVLDFWNRWHITLSLWMQRYVFTPLTISLTRRHGDTWKPHHIGVVGYLTVFILVGVWHQPGWRFLLFGALLGVAASCNKLLDYRLGKRMGRKRYQEFRRRALPGALFRCASLFAVAVSLSMVWAEPALARTIGMAGSLAALAGGLIGAFLLWIIFASSRKAGECLARAGRTGEGGAPLPSRCIAQLWLALKVFAVIGIVLAWTDNIPVFVYQGF